MKLLLKIKNGTPPQRKTALRTITDKAREFGAAPLFDQILPLLMSPTLEDQVSSDDTMHTPRTMGLEHTHSARLLHCLFDPHLSVV